MFLENLNNLNKVFLHGYIWFGLCGAAAALGVIRFGTIRWNLFFIIFSFLISGKKQLPETMRKAHQLASWLTGTIGMANLAAQYFIHNYKIVSFHNIFTCIFNFLFKAFIGNIHFATCALSVLAFFSRREAAMSIASHGVSVLAVLSLLAGGLFIGKGNLYAVVGAGLVIIASPFDRSVFLLLFSCFLLCVCVEGGI